MPSLVYYVSKEKGIIAVTCERTILRPVNESVFVSIHISVFFITAYLKNLRET